MMTRWAVVAAAVGWALGAAWAAETPLVSEAVVFEEVGSQVAVEAEHFFSQTHTDVRRWHLATPQHTPQVDPDGDPNHSATAGENSMNSAIM